MSGSVLLSSNMDFLDFYSFGTMGQRSDLENSVGEANLFRFFVQLKEDVFRFRFDR